MSDLRPLPYYKWFWQDWRSNRKIQRMSYIHRGLYRELLDECWVEGFIPNNIVNLAEICGCPEDVMANAWQVLESFFVLAEDGFLYNEKLHSLRSFKDEERLKKSVSGANGGAAKALSLKGSVAKPSKSLAKPSNRHIEEKRREENIQAPDGVDLSVWNDYLKIRKASKKPITFTALKGLTREAGKANKTLNEALIICCERSWLGFKAEWLKGDVSPSIQHPQYRLHSDGNYQMFSSITNSYMNIPKEAIPENIRNLL